MMVTAQSALSASAGAASSLGLLRHGRTTLMPLWDGMVAVLPTIVTQPRIARHSSISVEKMRLFRQVTFRKFAQVGRKSRSSSMIRLDMALDAPNVPASVRTPVIWPGAGASRF